MSESLTEFHFKRPDGRVYRSTPSMPQMVNMVPAPEPIGGRLAWYEGDPLTKKLATLDEALAEGWLIEVGEAPVPVPPRLLMPGAVDLMDGPRPVDDHRGTAADPNTHSSASEDYREGIAPPPPPRVPGRVRGPQALLTDEEFAVLDLLAEADAGFMAQPTAEPEQRQLWRDHLHVLEALVMRRAAIRAYPGRFVSE